MPQRLDEAHLMAPRLWTNKRLRVACLWSLTAVGLVWLLACESAPPVEVPPPGSPGAAASPSSPKPPDEPHAEERARPEGDALPEVQTRWPAPRRLVAIGDVHGDLSAARAALRLAGAIDAQDRWSGGDLMVVQTGDQLDRGDDEVAILTLLERLQREARAAGGALVVLNGNHEVMNIQGDMRYITPGSLPSYEGLAEVPREDARLARYPEALRPRVAAYSPGGPLAQKLARRPVVAVVGETVFAHGGVTAAHVAYGLEKINAEASRWAMGRGPLPGVMSGPDSPIWSRQFSDEAKESDCAALATALDAVPARRLVVGHTVQRGGVTQACEGRVWRIDVGMAAHYGGQPQVLEIVGEQVRVLSASSAEAGAPE